MVTNKYQFPKITPKMHDKMQEWYKTHNEGKCANALTGQPVVVLPLRLRPQALGIFL